MAPNPAADDSGSPSPDLPDQETSGKGKKRRSWPKMALLGLLALVLIGVLSGWGGYSSGIAIRKDAEDAQLIITAQRQFDLGVQELAAGQYERARQRFEYVIKLEPNFPGATDRLTEAILYLNATATPTTAPIPTVAATEQPAAAQANSDAEQTFKQAEQALTNNDWSGAIDALLILRKIDPTYRAVDVDGMLFLALRNRGRDKISKEADLEGGMYDLSLAKQFGPLDSETEGYLTWVSLYVTGASFWQLDWAQAVNYFSQVAPQLPSLRDASGMTASERYRRALIGFADFLVNAGDPCQAIDQYTLALTIAPDPVAEEALAQAYQQCEKLNAPPAQEQPSGEPPPAPTEEQPTAAPSEVPTPYPGPTP
jgi:tetratricopeptide (TPR) repeat protein